LQVIETERVDNSVEWSSLILGEGSRAGGETLSLPAFLQMGIEREVEGTREQAESWRA